jgi:hypothetical protein
MCNKVVLNTFLLIMLVSLTMIFSTKIATAGVLNNINIDIKSIQTDNNTALKKVDKVYKLLHLSVIKG